MTGAAGEIALQAPAKLNLGLRLMGRRSDGYHLLESIFAPIDLCDDLRIEIQPGARQISLQVSDAEADVLPAALGGVTSGPDNLAFRAASAFCEACELEGHVRIDLRKRIPAAAGLGGGSSDAAAVLRGLSALAGDPLDDAAVAKIALSLGADVPFFLSSQVSHVTGIGEIIVPFDETPRGTLVVANAGLSLNTGEVFRMTDALGGALTEPRAGSTMRAFLRLCRENEDPGEDSAAVRAAWSGLLVNDLEPAASQICPPVGHLLEAIRDAGALGAGMTGSGATVFGVFESESQAFDAAETLAACRIHDDALVDDSLVFVGSRRQQGRNSNTEIEDGRPWVQVCRFLESSSS